MEGKGEDLTAKLRRSLESHHQFIQKSGGAPAESSRRQTRPGSFLQNMPPNPLPKPAGPSLKKETKMEDTNQRAHVNSFSLQDFLAPSKPFKPQPQANNAAEERKFQGSGLKAYGSRPPTIQNDYDYPRPQSQAQIHQAHANNLKLDLHDDQINSEYRQNGKNNKRPNHVDLRERENKWASSRPQTIASPSKGM